MSVRQNPKDNTWQYYVAPSWKGNFQNREEAEGEAEKVATRAEESRKQRIEAKLEADAQHLNAVIRRAKELDPHLWAQLSTAIRDH